MQKITVFGFLLLRIQRFISRQLWLLKMLSSGYLSQAFYGFSIRVWLFFMVQFRTKFHSRHKNTKFNQCHLLASSVTSSSFSESFLQFFFSTLRLLKVIFPTGAIQKKLLLYCLEDLIFVLLLFSFLTSFHLSNLISANTLVQFTDLD